MSMKSRGGRFLSLFALMAGVVAAGCSGNDSNPTGPILPFAPFAQQDLRVGTGADAATGRRVTVNYTGWFYDPTRPENKGQQFDTSVGRQPFTFTIGLGQVIRGWDQGVPGMKVGGQRRLTVPPELGYGANGSGGVIPPNATLVFDIDLIDVQ
ncbi:MAG: FKBP-type peptidyl-prolyl cis-trans isomerase [Acidobacteria bacterium]|nr:FKBP-type peptidyl-prolyl cis-trans isomerase [Acidobacteriota bacterium]